MSSYFAYALMQNRSFAVSANQGKHPHELSEYVVKERFRLQLSNYALLEVGAHYSVCDYEVKDYFYLTFRESRIKTSFYLRYLK